MSIIDEQNILGDPGLAEATRPGSDTLIAQYSFALRWRQDENAIYDAAAEAQGGSWTKPSLYAIDAQAVEVTKSPLTQVGIAGIPVVDRSAYGFSGGDMHLTENATQKTKLSQVAKVIAGEAEPVGAVVNPGGHAVRSESQMQNGPQGPVASGGDFNGYAADNEYHQNPQANRGAGATTIPAPITNTGIKAVLGAGDLDATALPKTESENDNPQANRGSSKAPPNPQATRGAATFPKTSGASTATIKTDNPGGHNPQAGRSIPRVHKSPANPQATRGAATFNDGPQESGGMPDFAL